MLADAVFEAVSDITIATAVKRIVSDERRAHGQPRGDPVADRLGQPGRERERAHRQSAAEEQDDAPVDADRLLPAQRESARARQLTGSRNSRIAPIMAATDSGTAAS